MSKDEKQEGPSLEQQEKGTMFNKMPLSRLSMSLSDSSHWHSPRATIQSRVFFQHQPPNPGPTAWGRTCESARQITF